MNFYHLLNKSDQVFQKRIVKTIFRPIREIRNLELANLLMSLIAWTTNKYCEVLFFLTYLFLCSMYSLTSVVAEIKYVIRIWAAFKCLHKSCYSALFLNFSYFLLTTNRDPFQHALHSIQTCFVNIYPRKMFFNRKLHLICTLRSYLNRYWFWSFKDRLQHNYVLQSL